MLILRIILKILSYLLYIVTVVALYGGRANTEYFTMPAILTLAAQWLVVLSFVVAVAWLCLRRWVVGGVGIGALILCAGPLLNVVPLNIGGAKPQNNTFTLMTYNVIHGWDMETHEPSERPTDDPGQNKTFSWIAKSDADIVAMQELRDFNNPQEVPGITDSLRRALDKAYPYKAGDWKTDQKVFSKFPLELIDAKSVILPEDYPDFDRERYSFYRVNIRGQRIMLAVVHLYSYKFNEKDRTVVSDIKSTETAKESLSEFKHSTYSKMRNGFRRRRKDAEILRRAINEVKGDLIICGDFNDVPESYAYRLIRGEDLHDAYVETGFGPMATYNKYGFYFHLDQILYRGENLKAISVKKPKIPYSDHYPVIATFRLSGQ